MISIASFAYSLETFHFDIDAYLNPILPPSPLGKLPKVLSHFLGHRSHAIREIGSIAIAVWAIVSTFGGLVAVSLIFKFSPWIQSLDPPVLIGSLGAAAILEYNTLSSPLAQPRNAILGQVISAMVGVSVAQLHTSSASDAYLYAPLACALASAAMTLTGTLHPPGGATAVLAVADPGVRALRWLLVPLMAISCTVMVVVACLTGNILRRYPVWWWTPGECGSRWDKKGKPLDLEAKNITGEEAVHDKDDHSSVATSALAEKCSEHHEAPVLVSHQGVLYPPDLDLSEEELAVLEGLAARLEARRKHYRHSQ